MCDDDFFDDNIGPESDFDDDYREDCDDIYETEMIDTPVEAEESPEQAEQRSFDLGDALIFGSMIYGNAYEEAADERERLRLLQKSSTDEVDEAVRIGEYNN
jgi:hypothetical protein